jgi:hypothetical protein
LSGAECFIRVRHCPLASAADTSIDRHCPSFSTAIAQCLRLPWPIPEAGVCQLFPSSTSFASLPCPAPRLLLPSFIGMATVVAVAPSQMANCCVFFISCTPSSLSFALYHAIVGSYNVELHPRKSSINPSSTDFDPTAIRDVVKPRPANAAVPPLLQPCHPVGGMILQSRGQC